MTLSEYTPGWLAGLAHRVTMRTAEEYEKRLRIHVLPMFGSRDPSTLTRREIRAWLASLLATRKPQTVRAIHVALSAVLSAMMDDDLLVANPAHGASRRLWRIEHPARRLRPADLDALLVETAKGPPWFAALVVVGGLRCAELLGLQADDVAGQRVRVCRQYHGRQRVADRTKGGRPRWVDLSADTRAMLEARIQVARTPPHWLFSIDGRWPVSPSTARLRLQRTARQAGIAAPIRLHTLRHSYATHLREIGAPLDWLMVQLGHADSRTTGFYTVGYEPPARPDLLDQLDATMRRPGADAVGLLEAP